MESDRKKIQEHLMQQQNSVLEDVGLRNVRYFDLEIEKLDKWGEDRRNSLKGHFERSGRSDLGVESTRKTS